MRLVASIFYFLPPSYMLGSTTKLVSINDKKVQKNCKPVTILEIYQIDFICNILIPYLDNIEFRTKKSK